MEGEGEGEKHQGVVASRTLPTGDLAHNPGMCPGWELNQQPFDLQGDAPTKPHWPKPQWYYFFKIDNNKC